MDFIREYWPQLLAFITLVMALTTMKVDIDVLKDYSLSDDDFNKILEPDTNIFTYPQLKNVRHIDEIFDRKGRAIMLYLTENTHSCHWISLIN